MKAAAGVMTFACALAPAAAVAAGTQRVAIEGMRFVPETIDVAAGDRIVWTNADLVPHTVTGDTFDSQAIAPGASWSLVAPQPGKHPYACSLHSGMRALLIVH